MGLREENAYRYRMWLLPSIRDCKGCGPAEKYCWRLAAYRGCAYVRREGIDGRRVVLYPLLGGVFAFESIRQISLDRFLKGSLECPSVLAPWDRKRER